MLIGAGIFIVILAKFWKPNNQVRQPQAFTVAQDIAPKPTPYWKTESYQIETKALALAPNQMQSIGFVIPDDWRNARLVGNFRAQGGSGNDIEALITDEDGLINKQNNMWARIKVWYQSGRVTVDTLNVRLPTGKSHLIFENRFSVFSNKAITLNMRIEYERLVEP